MNPPTGTTGPYDYEWSLIQGWSDRPAWLACAAAGVLTVAALTVLLHRRERAAMPGAAGMALLLLRLVTLTAVTLFLLGPQRRRMETVTRSSQVLVLVDDSASMALADKIGVPSQPGATRAEAACSSLASGGVLRALAEKHVVTVAPATRIGSGVAYENQTDEQLADVFAELLRPSTPRTRLGDAIRDALRVKAGEPLAGMVLLSDGRSNAGAPADVAAGEAAAQGVPVVTIGFGPERAGANIAIREAVAPSRVAPADEIELTAVIEVTGEPQADPSFSLWRRRAEEPETAAVLLATVGPPDWPVAGSFTISMKQRPEETGRFVYSIRAAPFPGETQRADNRCDVAVEVVEQKTRVLIWAGGPNRDFRFLRGRLSRDDTFEADTLLQSAPSGGSFDGRRTRPTFPATAEQMDRYDVVVAFDPDWTRLTEQRAELLEQWVSRRGGGLYVAPGPVHTPRWTRRGATAGIEALLPVELPDRITLLDPSTWRTGADRPKRIRLTRAGLAADFLRVAGAATASTAAWERLPGFYRVGRVQGLRPGATVYATTGSAGRDEPLLAEQFYGAGRVFYSGVTELWRLRAADPAYFETYWTLLLRRLGQGRLTAGDRRTRLLFERPRYQLGETMTLRAIAPADSPGGAPIAGPLPAIVTTPRGEQLRLELGRAADASRGWTGSVVGALPGLYRAAARWPGGGDPPAAAEVEAPQAERDNPMRDTSSLAAIAAAGGGHYYASPMTAVEGAEDLPRLAEAIPSRTEISTVLGRPDLEFQKGVSLGLLGVIVGALSIEWIARRIMRLA